MKDALLEFGDFNIISVNYSSYVVGPNYAVAVYNSQWVGDVVGEFIQFLMDKYGGKLEDFHPIGFSLGGQTVGSIGEYFNGKMERISALDPAGPLFYDVPYERKLTPDDAKFVDVIYTTGKYVGTMQHVRKLFYAYYVIIF